jgi:hypothetical protein
MTLRLRRHRQASGAFEFLAGGIDAQGTCDPIDRRALEIKRAGN